MWYAKMYFSEGREIFQYDSLGTQGVPDVQGEFPFLESLLTFLEMDYGELTPSLQRIADRWRRLIVEDDRQAGTDAIVELSQLKSRHIYLEFLYVRWYDRRSNTFSTWCWMWTARDASRRRRQQGIIPTICRKIPACFVSALSPSALSRWSRGGVRRCCIPPASGT